MCDEHAQAYANTYNNQPLPNFAAKRGRETRYLPVVMLMVTKNLTEKGKEEEYSHANGEVIFQKKRNRKLI